MPHAAWMAALALATAAPIAAAAQPAAPPAAAPAPVSGKVYVLEMLQIGDLTADLKEKLVPLKTMADVEALLKRERVPFGWRIAEAPIASLPPKMVQLIDALPPHEVFVIPQKTGAFIAVLLETKQVP